MAIKLVLHIPADIDTPILRVGLRSFNGKCAPSRYAALKCLRTEGQRAFAIETYNLTVLVEYVLISILSPPGRTSSSCSAHYCNV